MTNGIRYQTVTFSFSSRLDVLYAALFLINISIGEGYLYD